VDNPCQPNEQSVVISTDDALVAMFNAFGMELLLQKYGDDCPAEAVQDAYNRAEVWLCGGLAIVPQPDGYQ
jgi:hypothetical protein